MMTADSNSSRETADESFDVLLRDARLGDRESLGTLLHWYANYLRSVANSQLDRRLRRRLNPSDIVQEAMLAAHRDFKLFRGQTEQELRSWLRAILIHVLHRCFDRHVKVSKRDVRREVSIDETNSRGDHSAVRMASMLVSHVDSPSTMMRDKEDKNEFSNRLKRLRPDYQQVIQLRLIQGLSFEEVAKEMNRSSGAVRMLWLRALDAFKSEAENADGGN